MLVRRHVLTLPRPRRSTRRSPRRRRARSRSASSTATRSSRRSSSPTSKGWELAVEEVNAAGGVLGRKLEVWSRDDNGNPGDAVRVAEELSRARRSAAPGHVRLERRARRRRLRQAAEGALHRRRAAHRQDRLGPTATGYTFRLRPSTYMQTAMLVPDAAKLKKKRWAIVYPNYEYGQSATGASRLQKAQPASSSSPSRRCRSARSTPARSCRRWPTPSPTRSSPRCSVPTSPGSCARATRAAVQGREVFNLLAGEPEYLDPLKDEAPNGWYVTGYPWNAIKTPEHKKFLDAYQSQAQRLSAARLGRRLLDDHDRGRPALKTAGSLDNEKLVAAMKGLAGRHAVRQDQLPRRSTTSRRWARTSAASG